MCVTSWSKMSASIVASMYTHGKLCIFQSKTKNVYINSTHIAVFVINFIVWSRQHKTALVNEIKNIFPEIEFFLFSCNTLYHHKTYRKYYGCYRWTRTCKLCKLNSNHNYANETHISFLVLFFKFIVNVYDKRLFIIKVWIVFVFVYV